MRNNYMWLVAGGDSLVAKLCPTLVTPPWTPLSMGFSRQEYWSGLPFPSPRGPSQYKDRTQVSCTAGRYFTHWATRVSGYPIVKFWWSVLLRIYNTSCKVISPFCNLSFQFVYVASYGTELLKSSYIYGHFLYDLCFVSCLKVKPSLPVIIKMFYRIFLARFLVFLLNLNILI